MNLKQLERKLTGGEKRSKEAHFKKLKKHKGDFVDRYGKKDGEAVMHAIATNRAKGESITLENVVGMLFERKVKGKLMCPEVCCGAPVMECTCGPSCKHCNCHEIQRLAKKVGVDEGYKKKKKKKKYGEALTNWLEENKMYGVMTEAEFDEAAGEKDACYHKVKSRYKVWPSAYASGALVQCRKKGAKNWGNKSKKK